MELIDNVNKTLKDDLAVTIHNDSKVSIAAACFSIYAFQELKREFKSVDELRFIFTSPTFIKEKATKEKREFYIPRRARERSLYGSEFEVKLRNEMTQRAIADGELDKNSTCKEFLQVQTEGTRQIKRNKKHYNFRMILAIGYRVRSNVGIHFRNWAS